MCAVATKKTEVAKEAYPKPFTFSISESNLQQAMRRQLAPPKDPNSPIVWVDGDSEVLVDPARLELALQPGLVLVELPLEADQSGTQKMVVPFSLGHSPADATLMATTESLPRGHAALAARWGILIQQALWSALLRIGQDRLAGQPAGSGMTVSGIYASAGQLTFIAAQPYRAQELVEYFTQVDPKSPPPAAPEPLEQDKQQWSGCLVLLIRLINGLLRFFGLPEYPIKPQKLSE